MSHLLVLVAVLIAQPESGWREPTPAEMAAARERVDKYVADPDYEVVDALTSVPDRPDEATVVYLKVRCLGPLGGPILQSWRIMLTTEGRGGITLESPFPDAQMRQGQRSMLNMLRVLGGRPPLGQKSGQADNRPSQGVAGRLPRPKDQSVRYVVVTHDSEATVYLWTSSHWREVGPALMVPLDSLPPADDPKAAVKQPPMPGESFHLGVAPHTKFDKADPDVQYDPKSETSRLGP